MRALGCSIAKLQRINNMTNNQVYKPIHMGYKTYNKVKGAP